MEAAAAKPLKKLPLPRCLDCAVAGNCVDERGKLALGGNGRIFLSKRTGRGVARVGEGLVAQGALALVQGLEAGLRHIDLSADLDGFDATIDCGNPFVHQTQRNVVHRANIHGNVFAGSAIATGGRLNQLAILVGKRKRGAVDLQLAHQGDELSQSRFRTVHPGIQLAEIHRVIEGIQALFVDNGSELVAHCPTHALSRRRRVAQGRMLLLDVAKLAHQRVKRRI